MLGSAEISESGVKVGARLLKRYVLRNEQVEVATRQHWAVLAEPVVSVLIGFFVVSWITIQLDRMFGNAGGYLWFVWLMLVARFTWKALEWRNEWFVATDKRLLLTYGLISHKVAMMPLGKVTDMTYDRSIMGRVLGYGTFLMESAGQDQALQRIRWVPSPDSTYRDICEIIFEPRALDSDDSLGQHRARSYGRQAPKRHDDEYDDEEYDDEEYNDVEHDGDGDERGDDERHHKGDTQHERYAANGDDPSDEDSPQDGRDESDDDDPDDGQPHDEQTDHEEPDEGDDWSSDHSSPSPPENAGWQSSREGASTYQRVMPQKEISDDDEDITGPIPVTKKES